ncbi:DNA (cytosine-5)-methyltransferase CMT3 [Impatiens glandulifera]|uniref:DNA (cytosine-5)-methyltransferase CMT3 n=1 Tax=Impatiens glandulifera TaxID=253017 RepID=UPI001FB173F7|nr:DNA (cytosine-5)-methyltransferase CMT3 [Impatiens glandulifera]
MPTKRTVSTRSATKNASSSSAKSKRLKEHQDNPPLEELEVADETETGVWAQPTVKKSENSDLIDNTPVKEEEELDLVEDDVTDNSRASIKEEDVDENDEDDDESRFTGSHIPLAEARKRWPYRYQGHTTKNKATYPEIADLNNESDEIIQAKRHYNSAIVDNSIVCNVGDDAYVKGEVEGYDYICRIIEMFEAKDGSLYFTAQWYYRAKDTAIKDHAKFIHHKRVFFSEIKDDNPLGCLVSKLHILRLPLTMDSCIDEATIAKCDYYCNTMYFLPYTSFVKLPIEKVRVENESESTISSDNDVVDDASKDEVNKKDGELALLDLFAGCGAMSTGLCLGSNIRGVNLVNKWAIDINKYACESLKYNHPETQVRNEFAEDFLNLLKEWLKLCDSFNLTGKNRSDVQYVKPETEDDEDTDDDDKANNNEEIFEVDEILEICYGDPSDRKNQGLFYKVKWKGYGSDFDSWEPAEGLSECVESIKKFVVNGYKSKLLPLPGDVDVLCGGPPCQGISGFNRFRNKENPLDDEKNKQLVVYMNLVEFLKPRFVLMENVVDILRFAGGFLGRYALGRLVGLHYQARIGMMAAGAYGLPQFRNRVFLWGARSNEKLPQYPLPTHDVVSRGVIPSEFEGSVVAHEANSKVTLGKALFLEDAFSDLPKVENDEQRDVMPYGDDPKTEFQKFIRLKREEMLGHHVNTGVKAEHALFDHRPLQLNNDDYQRVCQIPKHKGANFRNLKGVRVRDDNKVEWDPEIERVYLPSGKPLVPDYAMSFIGGTSSKPFARLWWDQTVPTVVTRAEPHNQAILHPTQDRVLTIRENARLQGFPDYYRLFGHIKERYIQVGNAVAIPVSRALGYALASAMLGDNDGRPLCTLPNNFPNVIEEVPSADE